MGEGEDLGKLLCPPNLTTSSSLSLSPFFPALHHLRFTLSSTRYQGRLTALSSSPTARASWMAEIPTDELPPHNRIFLPVVRGFSKGKGALS